MNRKFRATVLAAFASVVFAAPASARCATRHFYNNSTSPFVIALARGTCSHAGKQKIPSCVVQPGEVVNLHYTNGIYNDAISVSSSIYNWNQFAVEIAWDRCYIRHGGNTGNIVVNSDADGDVATCGPLFAGTGPNVGYQCGSP
jgi:hypothetical protein